MAENLPEIQPSRRSAHELPVALSRAYMQNITQWVTFCITLVLCVGRTSDVDAVGPNEEVPYPSGVKLPAVQWGDNKNYKGCGDLSSIDPDDVRRTWNSCHFFDPRSGTPVVKIEGKERAKLSPNFEAWEFMLVDDDDVKGGSVDPRYVKEFCHQDPKGNKECRTVYKVGRIDPDLVELMQKIRDALGFPLYFDEGYRPSGHNLKMYIDDCRHLRDEKGKFEECVREKSMHVSGRAIDLDLAKILAKIREICRKSARGKAVCKLKTNRELANHMNSAAVPIMEKRGGGGIGIGPTTMHWDNRKNRGGRVSHWGY